MNQSRQPEMSLGDRIPAPPISLRSIADAYPDLEILGDPQTMVTGITLDSRDVRSGDLFAALPGEHTHGHEHMAEAIDNGAVACLTDELGRGSIGSIAALVSAQPRSILGAISALIYAYPAQSMIMVGITGTNGKTTVAHLVGAGLRAAGTSTGVIGTAGISLGSREFPAIRTTPEAPTLHSLLAHLHVDGARAIAMEVSSHALELNRVDGVRFDIAAFTNLSRDHLDFHGTMEAYFAAKAKLFTPQRCARAVVSIDDEWGRRLASIAEVPLATVSLEADSEATFRCVDLRVNPQGLQELIIRDGDGGEHHVVIGLPARFNAANALIAWTILHQLSVDDAAINAAFRQARVPGRMELIDAGQPFTVVVDYAHTPDAVQRVLASLPTTGRIICVLGCGGDRDREKRSDMGRIAAQHSDFVIVTDDNPRGEDPAAIRSTMMDGMSTEQRNHVTDVGDRREAIGLALEMAEPGDTVAILGKGHETGQEVAGMVHPFDDRVVARSFLEGGSR